MAVHTERAFEEAVEAYLLDRQLRGTVGQFEQTPGIVVAVDKHSSQLAEALARGRHIVVTTLRKFPFILDRAAGLGSRTFAVVIDEAHSSQTGEAARTMRLVLADAVNPGDATEEPDDDWEDLVGAAALSARPNLTFVALTATPKFKTIEIFGAPGKNTSCRWWPRSIRRGMTSRFCTPCTWISERHSPPRSGSWRVLPSTLPSTPLSTGSRRSTGMIASSSSTCSLSSPGCTPSS